MTSNTMKSSIPSAINDTHDNYTKLFEEAIARQKNKKTDNSSPEMTPKEQETFISAMKDPEFRSLLNDYMSEISDPSHRAETELYISQLEQEQKLPINKRLLRPVPGFVTKVIIQEFKQEREIQTFKVFINICSNDLLNPPTNTKAKSCKENNIHDGKYWQLPYCLGPERMEIDHAGKHVRTFDICYHTKTLEYAMMQKSYRDMVISTALEAIEKQLQRKEFKNQVTHQFKIKGHKVLKGVAYKSGQPVTMCISTPGNEDKKKDKEGVLNQTITENIVKENMKTLETKDILPVLKTEIIHQGTFEMLDYLKTDQGQILETKRPKQLIVNLTFPEIITSAKDIELDVNTNEVRVKSTIHYQELHVKLPYPVQESKGKAKFDKTKRVLKISLPVVKPKSKVAPLPVNTIKKDEVQEQLKEDNQNITMDHVLDVQQPAIHEKEEKVKKPFGTDQFSMLREIVHMRENDPMYATKWSSGITEKADPIVAPQKDHQKECNKAYPNTKEEHVLKNSSAFKLEQSETVEFLQESMYTRKETSDCISFIVQIPDIEQSSIQVTRGERNFLLKFQAMNKQTHKQKRYELRYNWTEKDEKVSSHEWDIASENMVLIFYKMTINNSVHSPSSITSQDQDNKLPVVVDFQNQLLYELD